MQRLVVFFAILCFGTVSGTRGITSEHSQMQELAKRDSDCPLGHFGKDCEKECHCMYSTCDPSAENITCPMGCARGWLGQACDVARIEPEVNYYCLKDPYDDNQGFVKIMVKTNGIETLNLQKLNDFAGFPENCYVLKRRDRDRWLPKTNPEITVYTIVVRERNYGYQEDYPEVNFYCQDMGMESGRVVQWQLRVQESPGVVLENDLDVLIKCNFTGSAQIEDFKAARNLSVLDVPTETNIVEMEPSTLDDDVILTVVNASSNRTVTEATLGSPVRLRITFGLKQGSPVKAVRPHSCIAKSTNSGTTSLTTSTGCPRNVVPAFEQASNHTLETKWFPMFDIGGKGNRVTITCQYDVCFQLEGACDSQCEQGTAKRRRRRRAAVMPFPFLRQKRQTPTITAVINISK